MAENNTAKGSSEQTNKTDDDLQGGAKGIGVQQEESESLSSEAINDMIVRRMFGVPHVQDTLPRFPFHLLLRN